MKQADEWHWVLVRKNGELLASGHVDFTTRHELKKYFPQYQGFPVRLVRGKLGRTLTPEQQNQQFRSISEALSSLADAKAQP